MKRIFSVALIALSIVSLAACSSNDKKVVKDCNESFETVLEQGTCVNNYALEKNSQTDAERICNMIESGVKDTCLRNVAVKFEDKDLCFENDNEIETYICLANLAEKVSDPEICTEITRQKDEYFCYRKVAVVTLDATLCDRITDSEEYKQICIESVEYEQQYLEENAQ